MKTQRFSAAGLIKLYLKNTDGSTTHVASQLVQTKIKFIENEAPAEHLEEYLTIRAKQKLIEQFTDRMNSGPIQYGVDISGGWEATIPDELVIKTCAQEAEEVEQ